VNAPPEAPAKPPSIRRQLMALVLGALCLGVPALAISAYWLTLGEIDEVMNDSLQQTALLLADRDLRGAIAGEAAVAGLAFADTESKLVAIARSRDGTLLFTSEPRLAPRFDPSPGLSTQRVNDAAWKVFTVVQSDRTVQVAQPISVRRELAAESASQLAVPLFVVMSLIAVLTYAALRQGMKPLATANAALASRSAQSLDPLDTQGVPVELLPLVHTLNDLLARLGSAFEEQRHFAADAAHELRSPITALQLQAQLLERSTDPQERAAASAELAAGIARARRLIEQLLLLARVSSRSEAVARVSEPIDLAALARAAVAQWSPEAERRGIDLGARADAPLAARGDPAQIEMLLSNLVDNALRYARRGGTVDVVARDDGGVPVLAVIDDGPGIAPAERARVFDRFYRSREAVASGESGSGLGLAIVRSIAERHGAHVSLHDGSGGRGLEVRVSFTRAG
jgi:two-component system OmpR family sensor kinase